MKGKVFIDSNTLIYGAYGIPGKKTEGKRNHGEHGGRAGYLNSGFERVCQRLPQEKTSQHR